MRFPHLSEAITESIRFNQTVATGVFQVPIQTAKYPTRPSWDIGFVPRLPFRPTRIFSATIHRLSFGFWLTCQVTSI